MSRPDQSITFLRSFGYSVFRVPRMSAQPLDVLHRNGKDLTRLGTITDVVETGAVTVPPVHRDDRPGVNIEGSESSKVNVNIRDSNLRTYIGALGGGSLSVQTGFSRARSVTFTYASVLEDSIDVLALERFVRAGRISPFLPSGTVDKLIDDEIYVITSVLKTNRLIVTGHAEAGVTVQLDVPVIQQAVGANVKVGSEGTSGVGVAFEGPVPIPFAFQAVQLMFDASGEFLTTEALAAGEAAARAVAAHVPGDRRFLDTRGAFVRLEQ